MPELIRSGQLQRLQTLYRKLALHTQEGNDRDSRLKWACDQIGRPIESFKELTVDEGKRLIDGLQGQLGVKHPLKKRLSREEAHRAGTEGRRTGDNYMNEPRMASAQDLAVIEEYFTRLGWTRAQFDGWLASARSPLSKRANPSIRTSRDANRVRWALKGMLQHRGLWKDKVA